MLMEMCILVIGMMMVLMELVNINIMKEVNMLEVGFRIKDMALVLKNFQMGQDLMEIFKMVSKLEREYLHIPIKENMRVSSYVIICMAMESIIGQMEKSIKVNIKMIEWKGKVLLSGLTVKNM